MASGPAGRLEQQLQLLLGAYGYNYYSSTNQARSDDLLVRERAGAALSVAADRMGVLRGRYQERFVPPLTAENPLPPPEPMAQLRAMQHLQQALSALGSTIRSLTAPGQDRIWARIRDETATLERLLEFDLGLVGSGEQLRDRVLALTAESWQAGTGAEIEDGVDRLHELARQREALLSIYPS
ncbi:MAG TPA: hypothetical protein VIA06_12890 [Candidatus Dormibacteraeota bacterium]|nr:hypothetical protein [Candidatus Dormibacteraeota bacterium]